MTADTWHILEEHSQRTYGLPFVFPNIAIETCNACNRGCDFCPVGIDRKPVERMSKEMFEDIVDQLHAFGYEGQICLQWYNEPLADKRLTEFTAYARLKCPHSYIYFASNGDLLTPELHVQLVEAGLNHMHVSQYDGHIQDNVQAVLDAGKYLNRLHVAVRVHEDLNNTRGGLVQVNVDGEYPLKERCIRPDEQMVIAATGDVPLCCNDYHITYKIGNVVDRTLLDLWADTQFAKAWGWLREGDRTQIKVCQLCNEGDASYQQAISKRNNDA